MVALLSSLNFVRKNVHYLIIVSILFGLMNVLVFGGFNIPRSVLISITMFLVIYPVMINLKVEELFKSFKPKVLFYSLLINFTVSPLIAFILAKIFFTNYPELFIALMLLSFIPTSAMTAAWTTITGARLSTAMILIPGNLFFSAFIAIPFIFPHVVGHVLNVSSWTFVKSILMVFIVPLLLGVFTRKAIVKFFGEMIYKEKIKPELAGVSSVGVIILTFFVISLQRTKMLFTNYKLVLLIIFPLIIYYALMLFISTVYIKYLVKKKLLERKDAIVISYASLVRHLNITLAIILVTFAIDKSSLMVLLIILGFIVQIPLMGFYAQHFGKRFVDAESRSLNYHSNKKV